MNKKMMKNYHEPNTMTDANQKALKKRAKLYFHTRVSTNANKEI